MQEKSMVEEFWEKMIRAFLDLIIVDALRKQNMSAYGFVRYIHQKFSVLICPDTLYFAFNKLEAKGMIEAVKTEKSPFGKIVKFYATTTKGVNWINQLLTERCEIKEFVKLLLGNGT
jgi:DNA-binding PadR family transcriptional regulator